VLQEFLSSADNCFVEGAHGKYTNEIIIPFKKTSAAKPGNLHHINSSNGEQQTTCKKNRTSRFNHLIPARTFITGSEWLYVKIYCGINSAEKILKQFIKPLVKDLIAENKITQWFFIRYADPENHIRIRFHHPKDCAFWKMVLERLYTSTKKYLDDAVVPTIQTDTYNREIERYGINTIELSEHIFYLDSEAVLNCIDLLDGEEAEKYRWLLSARGVDMLLDDFNYSLESKSALLKKLQQHYAAEFGNNKSTGSLLNDKYRANMQLLWSFLTAKNDEENEIKEAVKIFTSRSTQIRKVVKKIENLQLADSTTFSFDELLPSYIHMFLNRMFLSEQRKYELVIYHFLSKYYDSQIAVQKKNISLQKSFTGQRA
jgi:thiopeptide-type bacteriocin biosynthesis protein